MGWLSRAALACATLCIVLAGCSSNDPRRVGLPASDGASLPAGETIAPLDPALPPPGAAGLDKAFPRRVLADGFLVQAGDTPVLISDDAQPDTMDHTLSLPGSRPGFSYAVYRFSGLTEADSPFNLGLDLGGLLPARCWLGCLDYNRQAWQWQLVAVPQASQLLAIAAGSQARSDAGNVFIAVATEQGFGLTIAAVRLEVDAAVPAPGAPQATTDKADRISLSWTPPDAQQLGLAIDAVILERAAAPGGPYAQIAELAADASTYDDLQEGTAAGQNNLAPFANYYYHLRLKRLGASGSPGLAIAGQRSLGDAGGLSATAGQASGKTDRISLSWNAVPQAQQYEIQYRKAGAQPASFMQLAVVNGLSYQHMWNAPAGKACDSLDDFEYQVRALGPDITSQNWSPTATGSRWIPTTTLTATLGTRTDGVYLSWTAVPSISGYRVYRDGNDEAHFLTEVSGGLNTYLDTSVDYALHQYYIAVRFHSDLSPQTYAYGERQGWATHQAGDNTMTACSIIDSSGKPFLLSKDGNRIGMHFAQQSLPASVDDWGAGWLTDEEVLGRLQLISINARPSFFCPTYSESLDQTSLYWIYATTNAPASPSDFDGAVIGVVSGRWDVDCAPLVIGQRVFAAIDDRGSTQLSLIYSTVDDPLSQADFDSYVLDADRGSTFAASALVDIGGKPSLYYQDGASLTQASSSLAIPSQADDWDFSPVTDLTAYDNDLSIAGFSAIALDGKPALVFASNSSSGSLYFARGLQAEPAGSSDWDISEIGGPLTSLGPRSLCLIQNGSGLLALAAQVPGQAGAGGLVYSFDCASHAPAGVDDWQRRLVEAQGCGWVSAMLVGTTPVACYGQQLDPGADAVWFASEL